MSQIATGEHLPVACRLLAFSSEGAANPASNVLASGGLSWQTAADAACASLTFDLGHPTVVRSVRLEQCLSSLGSNGGPIFATVRGEVEAGAVASAVDMHVTLFERQVVCASESSASLHLSGEAAVTRLTLELDVRPRRATFSLRRVRLLREATADEARGLARKRDAALKQRAGREREEHGGAGAHRHASNNSAAGEASELPLGAQAQAARAPRPLSAMLEGARALGSGAPFGSLPNVPRKLPTKTGAGARRAEAKQTGSDWSARGGTERDGWAGWMQGGGKRSRPAAPAQRDLVAPAGPPAAAAGFSFGLRRPSAAAAPAEVPGDVIDLISDDEDDDSDRGTPDERQRRELPRQAQATARAKSVQHAGAAAGVGRARGSTSAMPIVIDLS